MAITAKKDINWNEIKNEYIIDRESSFRSLSEKFDISASAIHRRAKEGNWAEKRVQYANESETKTLEKLMEARAKGEAKRIGALFDATDKLIKKVSTAISKLDPKNTLGIRQMTATLRDLLALEGVTPPEHEGGDAENSESGVVIVPEIAPALTPPEEEVENE